MRYENLLGPSVENSDFSRFDCRVDAYAQSLLLDQAFVKRKRPNTGRDVAAVARITHNVVVYPHLGKGVVDINIGLLGLFDDGNFGCDKMTSSHSVDLKRVWRSHDSSKEAIPVLSWRRYIMLMEEQSFTSSSSDVGHRNCVLGRHFVIAD